MTQTEETSEALVEIERFSLEEFDLTDEEFVQCSNRFLTEDPEISPDLQHTAEPRNKGVARAVACVAFTFIIVCVLMVGASLVMSGDIDSKGRSFIFKEKIHLLSVRFT